MNFNPPRRRLVATCFSAIAIAVIAGWFWPQAVKAQDDNLTPGMLFGPVWVGEGQHLELCSSNLGEGDITANVHFRNLTSGEVTAVESLLLRTGSGDCSYYSGPGRVVGMTRGEGRANDWVSPSNALIATLAVVDNNGGTRVAVLGVAKLWLKGL
jgi:hypothetical protein